MALWEVVFSGLRYGQVWQNKLHFESLAGFAGTAESIANLMDTHWVEAVRAVQTGDTQWFTIAVKGIGGNLEQFTKPIQKTGAQAPEGQSVTFMAGVMQKKTGFAGRSKRGRVYVPGIRQGATQNGQFQAFEQTNWNNACAAIKAQFIDPLPHDLRLIIKHPEGSTPVNALTMRPVLGVMRTRNIGVGV